MKRGLCIGAAVLTALTTGACGADEQSAPSPQAAEDAFIAELFSDANWKDLDPDIAIAAGRDFCTAVIEANNQGHTGIDAAIAVGRRYGLQPGVTLITAAKSNFCPDVDLG